jgi:hypothetical protein
MSDGKSVNNAVQERIPAEKITPSMVVQAYKNQTYYNAHSYYYLDDALDRSAAYDRMVIDCASEEVIAEADKMLAAEADAALEKADARRDPGFTKVVLETYGGYLRTKK